MGVAVAVIGFILFAAGSTVYIFVDFFLRRLPVVSSGAGDKKKRLDTISVRAMCAGFVIMWVGVALASTGF